MQEGWYGMLKFWTRNDITWPDKRGLFLNLIYNTGLSGMEPELTTRRQLRILDHYVLSCVRSILGRDNSRTIPTIMANGTTQLVRQQRSNLEVRTMFRLPTFQSELRYRKLAWLQDMIAYPEDNAQVRAALFGKLTQGREPAAVNPCA